jgi:hypothetical protein
MLDDTHSFVVRIWHEGKDLPGNATAWRGSIEHVGEGKRRYFVDLAEIGRYIREHVAWASQGGSLTAATAPENRPPCGEG